MQAYLDYDENAFRGKTILLPCDDPDWSNFRHYVALAQNKSLFAFIIIYGNTLKYLSISVG